MVTLYMIWHFQTLPVHREVSLIRDELYGGGSPAEELGRRGAVAPQRPDQRVPQLVVLPAVDYRVHGGLAEVEQDYEL